MRLLALLALAITGCASAYHVGAIDVEPTAGAGFAGLRSYEMLQQPALVVPKGCTSACSAKVLSDSIDLVPNHHYSWRPALSTGVSFQHYAADGAHVGGGIGLNIVVLPGDNGVTNPWPALTAHVGTRAAGFFLGIIISPTDRIALPPGVTSLRVQRDAIPDVIAKNTGKAGHLYFGIRLGGQNPTDSVSKTAKP